MSKKYNNPTVTFPMYMKVGTTAPLDDRLVVETIADLTNGTLDYPYVGMVVNIGGKEDLYVLNALPATNPDNWKRIAGANEIFEKISGIQSESDSKIAGVQSEMYSKIKGVQNQFNTEITNVNNKIIGVQNEMYTKITGVQNQFNTEITNVRKGTEQDLKGLQTELKNYTDKAKRDILGGATDAFDTLIEVEDWINTHGHQYSDLIKDLNSIRNRILQMGAQAGPNINVVGTPKVTVTATQDQSLLTFDYLKGNQGVQGARGADGILGGDGVQGALGNQGAQGRLGNPGVQGTQGSVGVQGHQGAQGRLGNQGVQGTQGSVGVQGEMGAGIKLKPDAESCTEDSDAYIDKDGYINIYIKSTNTFIKGNQIKGPQGNQGNQGNQGTQGYQGSQGNIGNQGSQGRLGNQGVQGTQGSQGRIGNQGAKGNTGNQGEMGAGIRLRPDQASCTEDSDAYIDSEGYIHIYIKSSNTFVKGNQIKGPQGNQGEQGDRGYQGVQGSQGSQGRIGQQGVQGTKGDPGRDATGQQGVQGRIGQQGVQGSQGIKGDKGNPGNDATGQQGVQGRIGYQGVQGTKGDKGDPGAPGNDGKDGKDATGPQGVQGRLGNQGVKGDTGTAPSKSVYTYSASTSASIASSYDVAFITTSSSTCSLTISGTAAAGKEIDVIVSCSRACTVSAPSTYKYPSGSAESVDVPAGGYAEFNFLSDGSTYYVRMA